MAVLLNRYVFGKKKNTKETFFCNQVSWLFNGEPLVSQDYQTSMEGDAYRLTIPEVFDEDAGRFSIVAENPSGRAVCSAILNVAPPLPSAPPPGPVVRAAPRGSVDLPDTMPMQMTAPVAYSPGYSPGYMPGGIFEREM
jgi:hypothetical protein